jgi:hypothetical protein
MSEPATITLVLWFLGSFVLIGVGFWIHERNRWLGGALVITGMLAVVICLLAIWSVLSIRETT